MARSIVICAMAYSDTRTITVDAGMLYGSEWKPLVEANVKLLLDLLLREELEESGSNHRQLSKNELIGGSNGYN